jgi:hypothetical protein
MACSISIQQPNNEFKCKCGVEFKITPLSNECVYLLNKIGTIDTVTGWLIEVTCPLCKKPI